MTPPGTPPRYPPAAPPRTPWGRVGKGLPFDNDIGHFTRTITKTIDCFTITITKT